MVVGAGANLDSGRYLQFDLIHQLIRAIRGSGMEQEQKSLLCHSWKLVNGFCHSSCAFELTYVSQAVTCTDVDTHINTHNALTKTLEESSSLLAAGQEKLPAHLVEKK